MSNLNEQPSIINSDHQQRHYLAKQGAVYVKHNGNPNPSKSIPVLLYSDYYSAYTCLYKLLNFHPVDKLCLSSLIILVLVCII